MRGYAPLCAVMRRYAPFMRRCARAKLRWPRPQGRNHTCVLRSFKECCGASRAPEKPQGPPGRTKNSPGTRQGDPRPPRVLQARTRSPQETSEEPPRPPQGPPGRTKKSPGGLRGTPKIPKEAFQKLPRPPKKRSRSLPAPRKCHKKATAKHPRRLHKLLGP